MQETIFISDVDMDNDPDYCESQFPIIFVNKKTYRVVEGVKGGIRAVEVCYNDR